MLCISASDYKKRSYLSAIEAAKYLRISVKDIHRLSNKRAITATISASGQKRFDLRDLKRYGKLCGVSRKKNTWTGSDLYLIKTRNTTQKLFVKDSARMNNLPDDSVHLIITSPPYFDTKMYSRKQIDGDLGNIHDVNEWFARICKVWSESFRVLQSGRKAFINIMNLPIRSKNGSFRTLNLTGRTIDECERIGFVFKRDIIWHKTNAVRAHFGTYPYPGGILINNMHEFILEFDKPMNRRESKYAHLTRAQKEQSRLSKEFWLELKKSDVWLMKPQGSGDRRTHIAPFPYELPYRLIKAFSYIGETVLDPFVGSGTTLRAAVDLGRNGVGYEINPEIACDTVRILKMV